MELMSSPTTEASFKNNILHVVEIQSDFIKRISNIQEGEEVLAENEEFVLNAIEEYATAIKKDEDATINKTFQYNKKEYRVQIYKDENTYMFRIHSSSSGNVIYGAGGILRLEETGEVTSMVSKHISLYKDQTTLYNKLKNAYLPITLNEINKGSNLPEDVGTKTIRYADHLTSGKIEFNLGSGEGKY